MSDHPGLGEVHDGEELVGARYVEEVVIDWSFVRANLERADFFHAWGGGANFGEANLKGALFSKANLVSTTFDRALAQGARFVKSDLSEATFVETNLEGADFRGAYLRGANFERANLRGASFQFAKVGNANFQGADLTGANFSGALFEDNVRFTDCRGFASIELASLWLDGTEIKGMGAHAWLFERVAHTCLTREDMERFFESQFALTPVLPTSISDSLPMLFSHAAFARALGEPVGMQSVADTTSREYVLSRWPTLRFVATTDASCTTVEFVGGDPQAAVAPLTCTVDGLRAAGIALVDEEPWGYDLRADIVVDSVSYRARFLYGVLVELERR